MQVQAQPQGNYIVAQPNGLAQQNTMYGQPILMQEEVVDSKQVTEGVSVDYVAP